jgi:hypothetical protein
MPYCKTLDKFFSIYLWTCFLICKSPQRYHKNERLFICVTSTAWEVANTRSFGNGLPRGHWLPQGGVLSSILGVGDGKHCLTKASLYGMGIVSPDTQLDVKFLITCTQVL